MLRADFRPPLTGEMEDALIKAASVSFSHEVLIPIGITGTLRHKLAWLARSVLAIDGEGTASAMPLMPYETPNVRTYHVDFLTGWSRDVATKGRMFDRIVMISPINPGLQAQYLRAALQCLAPGGVLACTATQAGLDEAGELPPFTATHLYEDVGLVRFS